MKHAEHFMDAARRRGVELVSVGVRQPADFAPAFAQMQKARVEALIILPSAQLTLPHRKAILALASQSRIPTLTGPLYWDHPGALFVMAPSQAHVPRRAAAFVDRILKGAKPGDLPIEQPNKYELLVDLRVARDLGITVPQSVVLRADKVIEH